MSITLWKPETDVILHQALGKLAEETNELGAILARCLIQGFHEEEPVTHKLNRTQLMEEIADVKAAMRWLFDVLDEPFKGESERERRKFDGFKKWQAMLEAEEPGRHATGGFASRDHMWLVGEHVSGFPALDADVEPVKPLFATRFKLSFNKAGNCTTFYPSQVDELHGQWVWLIDATDGMNDRLYPAPQTRLEVQNYNCPCAHPSQCDNSCTPSPAQNAALSQDLINLVIAAREAFDTCHLPDEESRALDSALEAFSSRVPYENEPEASNV